MYQNFSLVYGELKLAQFSIINTKIVQIACNFWIIPNRIKKSL